MSDLGITWVSCSGIHPEAITHFIPKSVKSTSQHLGSTPSTPCLRYHQQSIEKDWSDLGITCVSCLGIHPKAIAQLIPTSVKSTSQHWWSTPWTPCLRYCQQSKEMYLSDLGITCISCSGIHPKAIDRLIPKSVKSTSNTKVQHHDHRAWDIISKAKRRTGLIWVQLESNVQGFTLKLLTS